jgi:hypothetical protein
VYDAANSSAAPVAAATDPDSSVASRTNSPQATAASIAETRFNACAGSAPVSHSDSVPMAKYSGYPSRGVMRGDPTIVWNEPVSPKSTPGSSVAR